MTGCSVRVGERLYKFDNGYNLAKGTSIEIHSGPEAKSVKDSGLPDHDKV